MYSTLSTQLFDDNVQNYTVEDIATVTTLSKLEPIPVSIVSLINSAIFAIIFAFYLVRKIVLIIKSCLYEQQQAASSIPKKHWSCSSVSKGERNQIIMLTLAFAIILIQLAGIASRIIFDSMNIVVVNNMQNFIQISSTLNNTLNSDYMEYNVTAAEVGIPNSYLIFMYSIGACEIFFIAGNTITISIILTFITYVFLTTLKGFIGTLSSNVFKLAAMMLTITSTVIIILLSIMVVIVALAYAFTNMLLLTTQVLFATLIACYVTYLIGIIVQTVGFNVSYYKLLYLVIINKLRFYHFQY